MTTRNTSNKLSESVRKAKDLQTSEQSERAKTPPKTTTAKKTTPAPKAAPPKAKPVAKKVEEASEKVTRMESNNKRVRPD